MAHYGPFSTLFTAIMAHLVSKPHRAPMAYLGIMAIMAILVLVLVYPIYGCY